MSGMMTWLKQMWQAALGNNTQAAAVPQESDSLKKQHDMYVFVKFKFNAWLILILLKI